MRLLHCSLVQADLLVLLLVEKGDDERNVVLKALPSRPQVPWVNWLIASILYPQAMIQYTRHHSSACVVSQAKKTPSSYSITDWVLRLPFGIATQRLRAPQPNQIVSLCTCATDLAATKPRWKPLATEDSVSPPLGTSMILTGAPQPVKDKSTFVVLLVLVLVLHS